ncbi:MAG: IS200/IS605 family transposase [Anaerolineae bacterium]|jgi:putative transposase|nr:IS200/IS605 family transposase [Anaerolineae bacterium]
MPFWVFYYHLIWTTKYRQPIITPVNEPMIYHAIERKCHSLKCKLITINGVSDHVHLAVSIPPSIAVADVVSQLKGSSSYEVNHSFPSAEAFHWQTSYGALTLGEKALPFLVDYIRNQKQHHQQGTFIPYLESVDDT